jgi:hypothetical protein
MRSIVGRTILVAGTLLAIWNVDWSSAYWDFWGRATLHMNEGYLDPRVFILQLAGWALLLSCLLFSIPIFGFIWEALGDRTPKPVVDMTVD